MMRKFISLLIFVSVSLSLKNLLLLYYNIIVILTSRIQFIAAVLLYYIVSLSFQDLYQRSKKRKKQTQIHDLVCKTMLFQQKNKGRLATKHSITMI